MLDILKLLAKTGVLSKGNNAVIDFISGNKAEAAIPPESTGGIVEQGLGDIPEQPKQQTTQPMPIQQQAPQQDAYIGMLQSMMQQKPKSKWDKILDAIQQGSGILHTIGGDNTALPVARRGITPEVDDNRLKIMQMIEAARHNRAMEGRQSEGKESSLEKLKRSIVPQMAKALVGKDKPGWFTGDYSPAEAIQEALKGFGGGSQGGATVVLPDGRKKKYDSPEMASKVAAQIDGAKVM